MVKVLSPIHHGLRLPALGVKFRDGEADVDEALVPKVLAFAHLGVTLPEGAEVPVADDANDDLEDPGDESDADEDPESDDPQDVGDVDGQGIDAEEPEADDADGDPVDDVAVERPRGNASRDAWAAYATALGVPVDADASRDDIRELFE